MCPTISIADSFYLYRYIGSRSKQHFHFHPHERIRYRFIQDYETVFYRTRYLNILLKDARHVIVGIWDTDVLVPEKQLMDAINYIQKGCVLSFPYDGNFRFWIKRKVNQSEKILQYYTKEWDID